MFLIIALIMITTNIACYFLGVMCGRKAERIDNDKRREV